MLGRRAGQGRCQRRRCPSFDVRRTRPHVVVPEVGTKYPAPTSCSLVRSVRLFWSVMIAGRGRVHGARCTVSVQVYDGGMGGDGGAFGGAWSRYRVQHAVQGGWAGRRCLLVAVVAVQDLGAGARIGARWWWCRYRAVVSVPIRPVTNAGIIAMAYVFCPTRTREIIVLCVGEFAWHSIITAFTLTASRRREI